MKGAKTGGGPRKAQHDIAPKVRAAFLLALEELSRRQSKTFPQIMADWMEKDPIALLNAVSRFTVRESSINAAFERPVEVRGLPATDALLERFIAQREAEGGQVMCENRGSDGATMNESPEEPHH